MQSLCDSSNAPSICYDDSISTGYWNAACRICVRKLHATRHEPQPTAIASRLPRRLQVFYASVLSAT